MRARISAILAPLALLLVVLGGLPAQATGADLTVADEAPSVGCIAGSVNDQFSNVIPFVFPDGSDGLLLSGHVDAVSTVCKRNGQHFDVVQTFPAGVDRHGCTADDPNLDGRPDLFCSVGAQHGTSKTKTNEQWLMDADSDHFTLAPNAFGAIDNSGRGRDAMSWMENGVDHLIVGNAFPEQYASPNRAYTSTGSGWVETTSILPKAYSGGICLAHADWNHDGHEDYYAAGAPDRIMLATGKGYTWSKAWLPTTKSLGCLAADFNEDGLPDLATVNATTLTIWINTGSALVARYTLATPGGANLGQADVDGDGHLDLYVVRSKVGTALVNAPDLLLMGNGTGTTWVPFDGLPTSAGIGSAVGVIPNWNGHPAFVVTNGNQAPKTYKGPRQFITFTPTGSKAS